MTPYDAHRRARLNDQGLVFWLVEVPCLAFGLLVLAAAFIL